MKMQLKVVKADGSTEKYLHTKIIATVSNALACVDQADTCIAEELADVVTYFLYHKQQRSITTGEVLSIVEAVLTTTGYTGAAIALSEHHFQRRLRRSRIEVVFTGIDEFKDTESLCKAQELAERSPWSKSVIVHDLVSKYNIPLQTARTIASMVEEKVINMGVKLISASLIKQLVLADTAAIVRAQQQLQTA